MSSDGNNSDMDEYTQQLYAKRGRSDSLGNSSNKDDYKTFDNQQQQAFMPFMPRRREDTFHLKRGETEEDDYAPNGN